MEHTFHAAASHRRVQVPPRGFTPLAGRGATSGNPFPLSGIPPIRPTTAERRILRAIMDRQRREALPPIVPAWAWMLALALASPFAAALIAGAAQ